MNGEHGSLALSWLLTFLLHSTLLLGLAALITDRLRSETIKECVWKASIVGCLLTSFGQLATEIQPLGGSFLLPGSSGSSRGELAAPSSAELLPGEAIPADATAAPRAASPLRTRAAVEFFPGVLNPAPEVVEPAPESLLAPAALTAWAIGGFLALVSLALGWLHLRRGLADREAIVDGPLRTMLDELETEVVLPARVRLFRSRRITSPLATGLLRPLICVPERCEELSASAQRVMLAHELAHLVRRDPFWSTLSRGLEVIFFIQPLLRTARRRLDESSEFLCDAWAVQRTGDRIALAECLTEVAGWVLAHPGRGLDAQGTQLACGMAGKKSPLARRVERILTAPDHPSSPAWSGPVLAGTLLVGTLFVAPSAALDRDPGSEADPLRSSVPDEAFQYLQRAAAPSPTTVDVAKPTAYLLPTTMAGARDRSGELREVLTGMQELQPLLDEFALELQELRERAADLDPMVLERIEKAQRRLDGLLGHRQRVLSVATRLLSLTSGAAAPLSEIHETNR